MIRQGRVFLSVGIPLQVVATARHRKIKTSLNWHFGPLLPIFLEALHEPAAICSSSSVREESITRATTMIVCVYVLYGYVLVLAALSNTPCAPKFLWVT